MNKQLTIGLFLLSFTCLSQAIENAGKTIMAKGSVEAKVDNDVRNLKRRSPIYIEDLVTTGISSVTQLRMIDGGMLSLQPESELTVNQYLFNESTQSGNVSMTLIKGGLRTVTGALNKASNNYKMNTPVASIGVRGTHYEAEMLNGDLYLATWDGVIDIDVLVGKDKQRFSLGPNLPYKFAIVRANGEVEFLLGVPAVFSDGHSNNLTDELPSVVDNIQVAANKSHFESEEILAFNADIQNKGSESFFGNDLQLSTLAVADEDVFRSGELLFTNIEQHSIESSNGEINNLAISMNINFDTSRVSQGQISFNDNTGEWFAAMDGVVQQGELDLNINFASHNNNLANGDISGYLIDEGNGVLGNFNLSEIDDPNVNAGGAFVISHEE